MFDFVIKNETGDHGDDYVEYMDDDEPDIPFDLQDITQKEKLELDLEPFCKAFASNILLLINLLEEENPLVNPFTKIKSLVRNIEYLVR